MNLCKETSTGKDRKNLKKEHQNRRYPLCLLTHHHRCLGQLHADGHEEGHSLPLLRCQVGVRRDEGLAGRLKTLSGHLDLVCALVLQRQTNIEAIRGEFDLNHQVAPGSVVAQDLKIVKVQPGFWIALLGLTHLRGEITHQLLDRPRTMKMPQCSATICRVVLVPLPLMRSAPFLAALTRRNQSLLTKLATAAQNRTLKTKWNWQN
mmetsp:Transcript_32049/g.59033  ORF Transcript_32049/g.59033 Transcript_32049/m.59033 type:complete len:206 (+) Transcript_32049:672-1289(+)